MTQPTNTGTGGAPKSGGSNKVLIIVLVIVGVVVLGCCGIFTTCALIARHAAQAVHEGFAVDMRSKGVSMGGVTESGSEAKLPDNFPSDVPIYSGMKATFSMSDQIKDAGSAIFTITSGSASDVVAFYHDKMKAGGWSEDTNVSIGTMTSMAFSKDTRIVTLAVTPSDRQVTVQIVYAKK